MDSIRKANYAIIWYFYVQGYITGCWVALIPEIKNNHDISDSLFGFLLLLAITGAILAMPVATTLSSKYGSAILVSLGATAFALLTPVIGLPGPLYIFIIGLIVLGFCLGLADVSNNAQAVLLEKYSNKHKLGECHCSYAIGGLSGALISGVLSTTSLTAFYILLLAGAVSLIPSILFYFWLINLSYERSINSDFKTDNRTNILSSNLNTPIFTIIENDNEDNNNENNVENGNLTTDKNDNDNIDNKNDRFLLISLSILGGLAYFGEGSIGDWSAIFINETLDGSILISSLGFVFFQLFVAIGRYSCSNLLHYFKLKTLLQLSGIITSLGLGLVVYSPSFYYPIPLAIFGFAICGSGISIIAPLVISTAGSKITSIEPNESIAWVSSLSYVGILIGPPFIGGMTLVVGGLRYSLLLDACLLSLITIVATITKRL